MHCPSKRLHASVALALLLSGCAPEPAAAALERLTDRQPAAAHEAVSLRRSLRQALVSGANAQLSFPLERCDWSALWLSLGVRASGGGPQTVEFEVDALRPGQAPTRLLSRSVESATGWSDAQVDLTPFAGEPLELVLRTRSDVAGASALWGNPVLVPRATTRPNVILISIDTLGTKHMGLHGYERDTTPALARFAEQAVVFEQAIAHQPWTLTSHASLFTSTYPDTHGTTLEQAFAGSLPLLPEELARAGYFTAGLVNNPYLNPKFGYERGYDLYDYDFRRQDRSDAEDGRRNRSVEESRERLLALLDAGLPRPFFFFLHLIDVHSDWVELPYESPVPFAQRFVEPGQEPVELSDGGWSATRLMLRANSGESELSPQQVERFAALYDGGVAYVDAALGVLFEELSARGLYDEALIVVLSDHGEEFVEHGRWLHTQGYDECLRVPLLIKLPAARHGGTRVAQQVELIDVLPTLLELLDLPAPAGGEGRSLVPLFSGAELAPRLAFAKGANQTLTPEDVYVARTGEWKLIWHLESGATELYDLAHDPGETRDVAGEEEQRVAALLEALTAHREGAAQVRARNADLDAGRVELSEGDRANLSNLGYVGDDE